MPGCGIEGVPCDWVSVVTFLVGAMVVGTALAMLAAAVRPE